MRPTERRDTPAGSQPAGMGRCWLAHAPYRLLLAQSSFFPRFWTMRRQLKLSMISLADNFLRGVHGLD